MTPIVATHALARKTAAKPRWRNFIPGMILSAGIILCPACTPTTRAPQAELRLAFWGDLTEIDILMNSVAKFQRQYPQIKVTMEHPVQYENTILTQFQAGSAPDVICVEISQFRRHMNQNMFLDLTPFIQGNPDIRLDAYYPELIQYFSVDNHIYVLPRDIAPNCAVYYNKDMFDQAGLPYPKDHWQWPKDFLPVAQKLTRRNADGQVQVYGFIDNWPAWDIFILSNGGRFVDDLQHPTRISLDTPESLAALQFRKDLMYKHHVMPIPGQPIHLGEQEAVDYFVSGKAAMLLSGIWKVPMFREAIPFKWDVALFPQGPHGPRRFPTGGSGYAIMRTTRSPQAAWQLVKFLAGKPGQIELATSGLAQPAIIALAQSNYFLDRRKSPANKQAFLDAVPALMYTPRTEWWEKFMLDYMHPALLGFWTKPGTVEEMIKPVVEKANQELFPKSR